MAWRAELADRCPGCGTQSWEDPSSFEAVGIKCHSCEKLALRREDVYEKVPDAPPKRGVHIVLRRL